MGLTELVKEAL